jgi:hypothetical protein
VVTTTHLGSTFGGMGLYFCIDSLDFETCTPEEDLSNAPSIFILPSFWVQGFDTCLDLSPSASKKLLSAHISGTKHSPGCQSWWLISVKNRGLHLHHHAVIYKVQGVSTLTAQVPRSFSGTGSAWKVFKVTPQNLFVVQSSSRPSLRVLQNVLRA